MEYEGVIIDEAVPRTSRQRCDKLFDYLISISDIGPHSASDPESWPDDSDWSGFEDGLIDQINDKLPDPYWCGFSEFNPGTVIVISVDRNTGF